MAEQVRVLPRPPHEWPEPIREALLATVDRVGQIEVGGGIERRDDPLRILAVMAHHPTLLPTFLEWASTIALEGTLDPAEAEILALRAGWLARSEFEWGHHVVYARAAGLADDDIDRVTLGPDAQGWTERQRLLLRACDELVAGQRVSDATFTGLAAHFDTAQLVEIPFVVGQYTMLSMVANMLGVELEAGHPTLPPSGRVRT